MQHLLMMVAYLIPPVR